jgi:flagellar motility protein MotE (MotC chaperone)
MKPPRLLPVVIAATTALLLFKGVGLVTGGGYVLVGTQTAAAAGGSEPVAASADPTMYISPEITMDDASPTLTDGAPELSLSPEQATDGHGATGAGHAEAVPEPVEIVPDIPDIGLQAACPPVDATAATEGAAAGPVDCVPVPVNEHGDALAMELNSEGLLVPVMGDDGSRGQLIERLGERRESLETREKELELRLALVEAAEKRIEERTAALKALEARINTLVEEKKSDEKEQFAGIVAMYETMKPREAAVIFDTLDTQMLVRVARAMNPRKMAPILARMEPMKAKALTAGLARQDSEPMLDAGTVQNLANLPQIVGQ